MSRWTSNLLEETTKVLSKYDKKPSDVLWVGNKKHKTTWDNFSQVANNTYDNGFGAPVVDVALVVMGSDFWLERHEYDGSEWWKYKSFMQFNPVEEKVFTYKDIFCGRYYDESDEDE